MPSRYVRDLWIAILKPYRRPVRALFKISRKIHVFLCNNILWVCWKNNIRIFFLKGSVLWLARLLKSRQERARAIVYACKALRSHIILNISANVIVVAFNGYKKKAPPVSVLRCETCQSLNLRSYMRHLILSSSFLMWDLRVCRITITQLC